VTVKLRLARRARTALAHRGRLLVTAITRTRQPGQPAEVHKRSIVLRAGS
jgi:hypothetical protein